MFIMNYIIEKVNEPSPQAIYNFNVFWYKLILKKMEEKRKKKELELEESK